MSYERSRSEAGSTTSEAHGGTSGVSAWLRYGEGRSTTCPSSLLSWPKIASSRPRRPGQATTHLRVGQTGNGSGLGDEDAEGVSCRIRVDVEALCRIVRAVEEEICAEAQGPEMLIFQRVTVRDREVEMHLHGYLRKGPRRYLQVVDVLESQLATALRIGQHQPVVIIRRVIVRRLIARSVPQTQELAVELRQLSDVRSVQNSVQQLRESRHRPKLPAEWKPDQLLAPYAARAQVEEGIEAAQSCIPSAPTRSCPKDG